MSSNYSTLPLAVATVTGFVFVASIFISSNALYAAERAESKLAKPCACDDKSSWSTTVFADLDRIAPKRTRRPTPRPDSGDRIAALETVQYALSEVGDGSSYVWHRGHGKLSGIIRPTASFKDATGKVCRHVMVMLTSGKRTKKTEAIACRLKSGIWQLDG